MVAHSDKFAIFSILGFRALGDFALAVMVCAYLKRKIRNAALLVYAQNDRPYKSDLVNLCPDVDDKMFVTGTVAPLDWLDFAGENPNSAPVEIVNRGFVHASLVLSPRMISTVVENCAYEFVHCLRIPDALEAELRAKLIAAGASENRWLACIHPRQDGYRYRQPASPRSVDPAPFFQLADTIIGNLGGQVVCLGSANMAPAPARPNLIDLTKDEDFLLQAYALSRARFAVVTDSGMQHVANGLGVPFAVTNLELMGAVIVGRREVGAFHDQHLLLSRRVFREDDLSNRPEQHGKLVRVTDGLIMADNTVSDLHAIAERMVDMTGDCQGWRETYVEAAIEAVDSMTFPMPSRSPPLKWARPPWWEESLDLAEEFKKETLGPDAYDLLKNGKLKPQF